MKHLKKLPIEVLFAIATIVVVGAIAVDGVFVQKLPSEALRYPYFCFLMIFLACAVEIIKGVRTSAKQENSDEREPIHHNMKNFLTAIVMFAAYIVVMWFFGFIVSSVALMVAFAWRFKMKHLLVIGIVTAIVVSAIHLVFGNVLYIFLPKGLLFDVLF